MGGKMNPRSELELSAPRFPRAAAIEVARSLCDALRGPPLPAATERLIVAGSMRRGKRMVGDVEILYIPRMVEAPDPADFFSVVQVNLADAVIAGWEKLGILDRRLNKNGSETFGPQNKLMRHVATGIPVDLFAATADNWWNYLVCRTGPARINILIASAAQNRGWTWNPYGKGFSRAGDIHTVGSEREVFEFVGLKYLEPHERK
jgi:DNA polymerase/3'-5' exonuclease PolX